MVYVVVAVLAAVVGAIVIIVDYLKQRYRKSVSYRILAETQLLSVKSELKEKLKINYESKEVENVSLVQVEVFNSGNLPVQDKEYDIPITIFFGEKARVLTTEVVRRSYGGISVTSDGSAITLSRTLLNPGDSVTISALVTEKSVINVSGRIVGANEIAEYIPKLRSSTFQLLLLSGLMVAGVIGFYVEISVFNQPELASKIFFPLFFLSILGLGSYVIVEIAEIVSSKLHSK